MRTGRPRSGDCARRRGGRGSHTRAAFHGLPALRWPAAPAVRIAKGGGWSKGQRRTWPETAPIPIDRDFSRSPQFQTDGARQRGQAAERGVPASWGFRPPIRCAASLPWPCQPDPGASAGRVCDHAPGPFSHRNIFPRTGFAYRKLCFTREQWEHGNSHDRKAESCAFEGCVPVPTPSGRFGNMGTEMTDPDAGKSARVWLPPAPSSR
jgi:hypothetical protein